MPITVTTFDVTWPSFTTDPTDFDLTISAGVNVTFASFTIQGSVTHATIDVGLLQEGKFPITSLDAASLTIGGKLGGLGLSGTAFVAILREDANGHVIPDSDTTTAVAQRVLYGGVEGSLQFPDIGGVRVDVGLSQYGPLNIYLELDGNVPLGDTGLALTGFHGGINFSSLTTPTNSQQLATSGAYKTPDEQTPAQWEAELQTDVIQQLADGAGSGKSYDPFDHPFTVDAGVTLDTEAGPDALALSGDIQIDTTGKILIQGDLSLGGPSGVSLQTGAFIDLSKVASGSASLMVYVIAPASAPVLSLYGELSVTYNSANESVDIYIGGEVLVTIPGLPGGLEIDGSVNILADAETRSLDLSVTGSAAIKPLGTLASLAGHLHFDITTNSQGKETPELYGAFLVQAGFPLSIPGVTVAGILFLEVNTTSKDVTNFSLPNRTIEFLPEDRPGFWEVRGYSNTADPWTGDRFA